MPTYPLDMPTYLVSVRQVTISLWLLLSHTSRYETCQSLSSSSVTTPLVDFHHRCRACPSYMKKAGSASCLVTLLKFPCQITYNEYNIGVSNNAAGQNNRPDLLGRKEGGYFFSIKSMTSSNIWISRMYRYNFIKVKNFLMIITRTPFA